MKEKTVTYKKKARSGLLVATIIAVTGLAYANIADHSKTEISGVKNNALLTVTTANLTLESDYFVSQRFLGRVEADQQTQVSFELSGKLESLLVDEGDVIQQGDTLASLDTKRLQVKKRELLAQRTKIQSQLKLADSTLKRHENALNYKGVSSQQVDEAKQQREVTQASLNVINASIAAIDIELEKSTLSAPFDAYVMKRQIDTGGVVQTGQAVLTLQQHRRTARIGVAGELIDSFRVGERVAISIEGVPTEAIIKAILPMRNNFTRVVEVILDLEQQQARPGDLVEVSIAEKRTQAGYWVPISALSEGERGTWTLLFAENTQQDNTYQLKRYFVDVIHQESSRAFIRSFEHRTNQYVVNGLQRVVPGQFVSIEPSTNQVTEELLAGVQP